MIKGNINLNISEENRKISDFQIDATANDAAKNDATTNDATTNDGKYG